MPDSTLVVDYQALAAAQRVLSTSSSSLGSASASVKAHFGVDAGDPSVNEDLADFLSDVVNRLQEVGAGLQSLSGAASGLMLTVSKTDSALGQSFDTAGGPGQ